MVLGWARTVKVDAPRVPEWIVRQTPFDKRYAVEVENHRLHVMERGEGRAVLALHGNPTWGFLYREVARELRTSPLRVIAPDLVGLGYSTRPRHAAAHSLENHARWIARLVEALELRDWILVAQDWGGPIGLLAADRCACKPAGIVLLNTVIGPPRPGFRPTAFHAFSNAPIVSDVAFRALGFPQCMLWAAQGDKSSMRGSVGRAYCHPLRGVRDNAAPLAMARMVPSSAGHPSLEPLSRAQAYLESFSGPLAGVWGEADPVLGTVGRWVEKVRPDIRMVYTNAGHFLQEEVPVPIADAVRHVSGRLD